MYKQFCCHTFWHKSQLLGANCVKISSLFTSHNALLAFCGSYEKQNKLFQSARFDKHCSLLFQQTLFKRIYKYVFFYLFIQSAWCTTKFIWFNKLFCYGLSFHNWLLLYWMPHACTHTHMHTHTHTHTHSHMYTTVRTCMHTQCTRLNFKSADAVQVCDVVTLSIFILQQG